MKVLVAALSRNTGPTGVCRFAANLCLSIKPFAEPVLVIGDWQRGYFERCYNITEMGIPIRKVAISNRSISRNRWYSSGLNHLAQEVSADLIHATFPMPLDRGRSAIKRVGTVHDLYPFDTPGNFGQFRAALNRAAFRVFLRSVNALTCVSHTTLTRLEQLFPQYTAALKPGVIFNSVAPPVTPVRPSWLQTAQPFYLAVAQHRKNKNLARVLEAFASLNRVCPDRSLLFIVGEPGPETETLKELVSNLQLSRSVSFHSQLSDAELAYLYINSLALVSPSLFEGFCLPVVEATQYGCPTIVSDLPIFHEVANRASRFVDPLNVESIRNALCDLLLPTSRESTLEDSDSMNSFRQETVSARYEALYKSVISH
jgi:glycosyltransferase involved in cell wall biosynthesis